jgi:APA family basic amino acid/polyamine antiporter
MFWVMHSGIIAAIAVVFARYAGYLIPLGPTATRGVAIGTILVLTLVNYFGVRQGSRLQTWFTAGKLIAVAGLVVMGLAWGGSREAVQAAAGSWDAGDFIAGVAAGLFAFGGWHMVTYSAEETVAPQQTIPRALAIGTMLVTAAYLALNAVYLRVLPLDQVAQSTRVAADFAEVIAGTGAGGAISGLVLFSAFGALAGIVLTGPRVYLAMARDGLLFRWLGEVHPLYRTPHRALLLQAIWSSVLVATGSFRVLFTRVIYTEWIFFGLLALGLMRLRRRPDLARAWSVRGYPFLPVLFAVAAFGVVVNEIVSDPWATASGLGLVLAGIPVYYLWGRKNRERKSGSDSY